MSTGCAATTREGRPCKGLVRPGNEYCPAHDPGRAEARRRAARKAGRSKPGAELSGLKAQLSDLYASVLADMVGPKVGAVLAQITNAQIRLTEVELKLREQLEVVERIERLEQHAQQRGGTRR